MKSRVSSNQIRDSTRKWVGVSGHTDGVNSLVATTSTHILSTRLDGTLPNLVYQSQEVLQLASAESGREMAPNTTTNIASFLEEQQTVRSADVVANDTFFESGHVGRTYSVIPRRSVCCRRARVRRKGTTEIKSSPYRVQR